MAVPVSAAPLAPLPRGVDSPPQAVKPGGVCRTISNQQSLSLSQLPLTPPVTADRRATPLERGARGARQAFGAPQSAQGVRRGIILYSNKEVHCIPLFFLL